MTSHLPGSATVPELRYCQIRHSVSDSRDSQKHDLDMANSHRLHIQNRRFVNTVTCGTLTCVTRGTLTFVTRTCLTSNASSSVTSSTRTFLNRTCGTRVRVTVAKLHRTLDLRDSNRLHRCFVTCETTSAFCQRIGSSRRGYNNTLTGA